MALKHYSHYRNSTAATQMYEVVSPALFEVDLTFPTILSGDNSIQPELIIEHVRSVSGLDGLTPSVANVVQKYKMQRDSMLLLVLIKHLLSWLSHTP